MSDDDLRERLARALADATGLHGTWSDVSDVADAGEAADAALSVCGPELERLTRELVQQRDDAREEWEGDTAAAAALIRDHQGRIAALESDLAALRESGWALLDECWTFTDPKLGWSAWPDEHGHLAEASGWKPWEQRRPVDAPGQPQVEGEDFATHISRRSLEAARAKFGQPQAAARPSEAYDPAHPDHDTWVARTGVCVAGDCPRHPLPFVGREGQPADSGDVREPAGSLHSGDEIESRDEDEWCNCQAIPGSANYPGPWHPVGNSGGYCTHAAAPVSPEGSETGRYRVDGPYDSDRAWEVVDTVDVVRSTYRTKAAADAERDRLEKSNRMDLCPYHGGESSSFEDCTCADSPPASAESPGAGEER